MKRSAVTSKIVLAVAAGALVVIAEPAPAYCKYKAADGSWTYSQNCAAMSNQEIDRSGNAVIRHNEARKKPPPRLEGRRLRGYDYSTSTHSGMRIREVQPNRAPEDAAYTSQ